MGSPSVIDKMLHCNIKVPSSNSNRAITFIFAQFPLENVWASYFPSYESNSITAVVLLGWLCHKIAPENWYAIKHRNQTIYMHWCNFILIVKALDILFKIPSSLGTNQSKTISLILRIFSHRNEFQVRTSNIISSWLF